MKRLANRLIAYVIACAMLLGMIPTVTYAGEQQEVENVVTSTVHTITGFEALTDTQATYIINKANKPSLASLVAVLPQSLNVYVGDEVRTIDVSWYCVGEDFDTSDSYYFQFSPKWDEAKYTLTEEMDVLKDAPYIRVFLTADGGTSEAAVTSSKNETIIYNFLINEMGFHTAAACGILANIYKESAFNPNALGDNGTSYGICQWHNSRWDAMKKYCNDNGYDWKSLIGQLQYLKFELSANNSNYLYNGKKIYNYISAVENTAEGAYDAAHYWCYYFEVPANKEQVSVTRGNLAKDTYWEAYKGQKVPVVGSFVDVYEGLYFTEPVRWAYENKITSGVDAIHFAPDATCTRGQVVTFLWRAMGSPEPMITGNPFEDIAESDYFYKPVLWAAEKGITSGVDETHFDPNVNVTRGQFVTFLHRAQGKPAYMGTNHPFVDVADAEIYYYHAVLWALENKITSGVDETHFRPEENCTRGQVVTFLYRVLGK